MTGEELMPYGKYQGTRMDDVPADYYFYLWKNGKRHDHIDPVGDYIRENLDALQLDYPDGIWD